MGVMIAKGTLESEAITAASTAASTASYVLKAFSGQISRSWCETCVQWSYVLEAFSDQISRSLCETCVEWTGLVFQWKP